MGRRTKPRQEALLEEMLNPDGSSAHPELLGQLGARAEQLGASLGLPADHARKLGECLVEDIADAWGGAYVYVPKGAALNAARKHGEIFKAWLSGTSAGRIAEDFRLAEPHVRQILAGMKRRWAKLLQQQLPGMGAP